MTLESYLNGQLEFSIVNDQVLEFTYNPDDKHQYFGSDLRHIKSRQDMISLLDSLNIKYLIYQEISIQQFSNKELSQNRIHYHGVIQIQDAFQFILVSMYKLTRLGGYQLNYLRPDWLRYCYKQRNIYKNSIIPVKQVISNTDPTYWREIVEIKSIKNQNEDTKLTIKI